MIGTLGIEPQTLILSPIPQSLGYLFYTKEASVVQWYRARLLANRSCARGMIHNKIKYIRPGGLLPSIALTVQSRGLKHDSFIHLFYTCSILAAHW